MNNGGINRLNIFIDETGEFGLGSRSAKIYGVSLVLHEQNIDISKQLRSLDGRLNVLGFSKMIHMGDLINGHGDFEGMSISERKKIYSALFRFSASVKMKYSSLFFEKRYADNVERLAESLRALLRSTIEDNLEYLQKFDKIVVYYDSGQKPLARIIDEEFGAFSSYERRPNFDHFEKKLFQVADMLTFVDKLVYKHKHKLKLSSSEKAFFSNREIRGMTREIDKRRLIKRTLLRVFF